MGNGTAYLLPEQKRRVLLGLCVDCGIKLSRKDEHDHCIRCVNCRMKRRLRSEGTAQKKDASLSQFRHMDTEPPQWIKEWCRKKLRELSSTMPKRPARAWPLDMSRCPKCQWITYTGQHHWFCPLPYCGYDAREEYEPENPLGTTIEQVR